MLVQATDDCFSWWSVPRIPKGQTITKHQAYVEEFGLTCTAKLAVEQRKCITATCESFSKKQVTQIDIGYFEYAVGHAAWSYTFEHLGVNAPVWP
ncbi:hypothetical protein ACHAP5_009399 [Fusarium lateritium]